jgi:CRP/FNR family transcriptional regulator, transcriptional activator FtrB
VAAFATELTLTPRRALDLAAWLAAVPARTLDALAEQSVLHRVPAGAMLFEQAETPGFAQFLIQGAVELLAVGKGDELLIEVVEPVDLLLPAAVLNRQPYLLRARVLQAAHLLLVHAEAFRRTVAADHELCLGVLACQAAQFRRQVRQAKNVRLRSAEERVGCYVRALIANASAGESIRLPLEKRLIASQLGMTRETFSRALASMARFGVRVSGDALLVDDAVPLLAQFHLDPLIDGREPIIPLPKPAA